MNQTTWKTDVKETVILKRTLQKCSGGKCIELTGQGKYFCQHTNKT
jgi:hypothetical protein